MKLANPTPIESHKENIAHVLKSINEIWRAMIEKRYADAEFAAYVALAEIQDFSAIKDESPLQLRLLS